MSDVTPPDLNPIQTAADAAVKLNHTEALVRKAQALRKERGEAHVMAAALHKKEFRKARLDHLDASSDKVRDDLADATPLSDAARQKALEIALHAGLTGVECDEVGDLETLATLAKEGRDSARDAAKEWERWGSQWQSVVGWCRDDAAREMGGRR